MISLQYRHEWKHEISVFDVLCLRIAGGKTLLTFAAPNSFSAVLVSCPEMQLGSTYTLTLGATSQEITLTQVADSYGVSGGMGQGGGHGLPQKGLTPPIDSNFLSLL